MSIELIKKAFLSLAIVFAVPTVTEVCLAQSMPERTGQSPIPFPAPAASPTPAAETPLTEREKQMLEIIRNLQERVTRLENSQKSTSEASAAQTSGETKTAPQQAKPVEPSSQIAPPDPARRQVSGASGKTEDSEDSQKSEQSDEENGWGSYTPNLGFKLVDTKYGDVNLSIYTYVRYLNQLGLDGSYTDAFGNIKSVQRRQDVQLQKLQVKFLGWVLDPKLRYFLYAWTSNANQGLGAQVVLAGNLNYMINRHITIGGGIKSLPGTRSVEGNFPFWTNVDSRHIADEFFRPSYTTGFWATV